MQPIYYVIQICIQLWHYIIHLLFTKTKFVLFNLN